MKVLYLTHTCPYPPNKGDRIRSFNILRHLAKTFEVTLVFPSFSEQDMQQVKNLQPYCRNVHTARLRKLIGLFHCVGNLFSGRPLTEAFFFSRTLQEIVSAETFDIVLVDCSSMSQYVTDVAIPKILDFVDVDSDKWRMYAEATFFPKSTIFFREYKLLQSLEEEIISTFNASLIISENEKRLLPKSEKVHVVSNGIDLQFFSQKERIPEVHTLIFTGAMDYFPNVDGVLYFYAEILPFIQMQIPSVKFIIAGMKPTPAVKRLEGEGVIVTGFVEDIRMYLAKATMCVVPLRIARGVQNKVLEAMAMKVPVVATSCANQGINAQHMQEIFLADTPSSFADAVVQGLSQDQLRKDVGNRARQFVEEKFCWEKSLSTLSDLVKKVGE